MTAEGKSIVSHTFHHSRFADIRRLVGLKERQGVKISLAFPTFNEAATIGKEILIIRTELMTRFPLIDEIAVIDSDSTDDTCRIAAEFGARVHRSRDILRRSGSYRGKGENLWKSLFVLDGDIIVWIDADIKNIHPKFVYGLVGPLLENERLSYVKAFYERPLSVNGTYGPGGGRVTEILVRPLFSMFFPELAQLVQPLSGEYASRRPLLENLSFSVGYGVELGHLVDIYQAFGPEVIAQVDLDRRIHRNQTLADLGKMSFGILTTFFNRLEKYFSTDTASLRNEWYSLMMKEGAEYDVRKTEIAVVERPPMIDLAEYRNKFHRPPAPVRSGAGGWFRRLFRRRRG